MTTHVIHCLSVDISATQGLLTCFALSANISSSQAGSDTRKKLTSVSRSKSNLRRSLSCSANASFCTSCTMNSALATTAYQLVCKGEARSANAPRNTAWDVALHIDSKEESQVLHDLLTSFDLRCGRILGYYTRTDFDIPFWVLSDCVAYGECAVDSNRPPV